MYDLFVCFLLNISAGIFPFFAALQATCLYIYLPRWFSLPSRQVQVFSQDFKTGRGINGTRTAQIEQFKGNI